MKRVVFIGNCQLQALSALYRRFSEGRGEEIIAYLPSYESLTLERTEAIVQADLIIEQRLDLAPQVEIDGIIGSAERHFVPLLAGGFLWPFAGQPHPRNESFWFMPSGPYDGEMGDSYLNRLIDKGAPPPEAVAQYLTLDVGRQYGLDRRFELLLDRQRSRDAACGYQIADIIEERFREEPLFRTPHHPNLRIALSFTEQFFQRMGMSPTATKHLYERVRVTPFPKVQLPIHPAVARHFKLKYADYQTRYRIYNEGRFTFSEHALRYMKYEWNRDLAEGMALPGRDVAQSLAKLEAGLACSPKSADGWVSFAEALGRSGRLAEAETAVMRGIAIDPMVDRHHHVLGHILMELGRLDDAIEVARRAATLDPRNASIQGHLSRLLARNGDVRDAETNLRTLLAANPDDAELNEQYGYLLFQLGRPEEAESAFRRAIDLAPSSAGPLAGLSYTLARVGRHNEAIAAIEAAIEFEARVVAYHIHRGNQLWIVEEFEEAASAYRVALVLDPANRDAERQLRGLQAATEAMG